MSYMTTLLTKMNSESRAKDSTISKLMTQIAFLVDQL